MSLIPSFSSNVLYWLDLIYNDDPKVYVRRVGRVIYYKTLTYFNVYTITRKRTKAFLAIFDIQRRHSVFFVCLFVFFISNRITFTANDRRDAANYNFVLWIRWTGEAFKFYSKVYQIFIMLTESVLYCDIL